MKSSFTVVSAIIFTLFAAGGLFPSDSLPVGEIKTSDQGKFPSNWKCVEKNADIYRVEVENGMPYIAARSDQSAGFVIAKAEVNPRKYQILRGRWRALKLPAGGDETSQHGPNDCGASVYVIFDRGLTKYLKHTIRYTWSSHTHPKGFSLKRKKVFYVIKENRETPLNEWIEEEVNFYEDYKQLFRKDPPEKILAIGIQSDSDDTGTQSWADYVGFTLVKKE